MNYNQAERYLYNLVNYEKSQVLWRLNDEKFQRVRVLFQLLGDPHLSVPCIHVAGTKGKGSTAVFIASGLAACGYTAGIYTSPHLLSLRERIGILQTGARASMIPKPALVKYVKVLKDARSRMERQGMSPTFFEVMTAMAFLYFRDQKVDYAVIETGMGGTYDATNIVTPLCSVITRVDFDHMDYLGKTLATIASQKAGIIKEKVPIFSASQRPEALRVIKKKAKEKHATLQILGRDFHARLTSQRFQHVVFEFQGTLLNLHNMRLAMSGAHQIENAAVALQAVSSLTPVSVRDREKIKEVFARLSLSGRFQCVRRRPVTIVDVAHNALSIQRLTETMKICFPHRPVRLVFGVSQDKDILEIFARLKKLPVKQAYFTRANLPRAMDPRALKKNSGIKDALMYDASSDAFRHAIEDCDRSDIVLICGSFYLVEEALRYFKRREVQCASIL